MVNLKKELGVYILNKNLDIPDIADLCFGV